MNSFSVGYTLSKYFLGGAVAIRKPPFFYTPGIFTGTGRQRTKSASAGFLYI